MTISFDAAACQNAETAMNTEWLSTNGLGGYASATIAGANTRKYHGLLVVAAYPPVQRYVVLSRAEDRLVLPTPDASANNVVDLSTNEFSDHHSAARIQEHLGVLSLRKGRCGGTQIGDLVLEKVDHADPWAGHRHRALCSAARRQKIRDAAP